jgi:hypothetical protein
MKFVSVTRTGNENDIIEAFVRHHAKLFDLLLIVDDDSTDGTGEILAALQEEGLPLVLFKASEVGWQEADLVTELARVAFRNHGATWVAPLDADEFLELPAGAALANMLPKRSMLAAQLRWSNFVWSRKLDERLRNPVQRLRTRMPPRTDSYKLIVPLDAVMGDPDAMLLPGNHGVRAHGRNVDLFYRPELALCHYPIRSLEQIMSKVVINSLRYKALPGAPETAGFQYERPIELLKHNYAALPEEMERASHIYALQQGGSMEGRMREQPLRYLGGALKYGKYQTRAISNIVTHAEKLALRVAELERTLAQIKAGTTG